MSDTIAKIQAFANLKKGWRLGGGVEFAPAALEAAVTVAEAVAAAGFKSDAFPRRDGGVAVTAYDLPRYWDFSRQPDGLWDVSHEVGDKDIEFVEMQTLNQVLAYVAALKKNA